MDIANAFGLGKTQAELDFVNVDPDRDTPLFVDPYALEIKDDAWSTLCADHLRSFFAAVLDALRDDNVNRARHLTSHLGEADETFLGLSRGRPQGRGVGSAQADLILAALRGSRAVQSGILSDIAEAELFIDGIGPDKISDLTTNVIRGPLIRYTQDQCALHEIPCLSGGAIGPVWDPTRQLWHQSYHTLPRVNGRPFLLVPKYAVRRRLSLDGQEFYNHHMLEFLRAEHLNAHTSLVETLRNGRRRVTKKVLKEKYPRIKDDLADFVKQHPEVLETYREIQGAKGPLSNRQFDEAFAEPAYAESLIAALREIPSGNNHASKYHSFMTGVLSFLFYPSLIYPVMENKIHEGRKRIDIVYTRVRTHNQ